MAIEVTTPKFLSPIQLIFHFTLSSTQLHSFNCFQRDAFFRMVPNFQYSLFYSRSRERTASPAQQMDRFSSPQSPQQQISRPPSVAESQRYSGNSTSTLPADAPTSDMEATLRVMKHEQVVSRGVLFVVPSVCWSQDAQIT